MLLVEDDDLHLQTSSHTLNQFNFNIDVAQDGEEAIAICKEKAFDIILMDIDLPEKNGIEATIAIQKLGENTKVIALSSYAKAEIDKISSEVKFEGFLNKPLVAEALLFFVNSIK